MNNEEKDINKTEMQASNEEMTVPNEEQSKIEALNKTELEASNEGMTVQNEDQSKIEALNALQDDIIRNDTIPETSRNTPGSNGAFPVGAFDTSKDY